MFLKALYFRMHLAPCFLSYFIGLCVFWPSLMTGNAYLIHSLSVRIEVIGFAVNLNEMKVMEKSEK